MLATALIVLAAYRL